MHKYDIDCCCHHDSQECRKHPFHICPLSTIPWQQRPDDAGEAYGIYRAMMKIDLIGDSSILTRVTSVAPLFSYETSGVEISPV